MERRSWTTVLHVLSQALSSPESRLGSRNVYAWNSSAIYYVRHVQVRTSTSKLCLYLYVCTWKSSYASSTHISIATYPLPCDMCTPSMHALRYIPLHSKLKLFWPFKYISFVAHLKIRLCLDAYASLWCSSGCELMCLYGMYQGPINSNRPLLLVCFSCLSCVALLLDPLGLVSLHYRVIYI